MRGSVFVEMNMRMFRLTVLLAAGTLAGSVMLSAQDEPTWQGSSPEQALKVKSQLVTLDVVVVDRDGKFVDGLDQSKFHIVESKVPQTIRNFDVPSMHLMPAADKAIVRSAADLDKIGNAPVNVLVIDELNTPFMQIAYSQQMMVRYLKRQPEILPTPTLFLAAGASHIAVLHDYTQSRDDLIASVKQHVTEADFEVLMSSLNGGRIGATGGMGRTLGAMSQIATSMVGFPGRKNVIWVGTGYKRANDNISSGSGEENRVSRAVRTVTNRMLAAHITLYTIDPEGPAYHSDTPFPAGSEGDGIFGSYANAPNLSFESFARSTGGRVLFGRNDIETEVKETTYEGSRYYTMAFVPTVHDVEGHPYHAIRVTVDDPNLRVITRDGFFGGTERNPKVLANTEKEQHRMLRFDLLGAATTTMAYTGLHTEAATAKNGYALLVRGNDLHWTTEADGTRTSEVTVLAVCYNAKGKELSQHAAELVDVLEAKDVLQESTRVGFSFPMNAPPGTSRVRFVLRDAKNGTMGSANFEVAPVVASAARP